MAVKNKRKVKAAKKRITRPTKNKGRLFFEDFFLYFKRFKEVYFTTNLLFMFLAGILLGIAFMYFVRPDKKIFVNESKKEHWMVLKRDENVEYLYWGEAGNRSNSDLVREFVVKTGVSGERPTPLPQKLGKNYWKIVKKYPSKENPETAPYFLELDVPIEDGFFGPVPYDECNGQCSWELPGYFGLHGVNGDLSKLSKDDPGSSGCIRHSDEDITYLYNLLNVDEGVRYYIE